MARTSKTIIGGGKSDEMVRASAQGQESVDRGRASYNQQVQFGRQETDRMASDVGSLVGQHQQMQQQQGQFDRQMQQRETETDLDAAKSGFQRGGGDRAAQLEQEMAEGSSVGPIDPQSQERLRQQGSKGLEDAGGRWVPTEERKQDQQRKNFEADTDRIKAMAYADEVGLRVQNLQMKGDYEAAKLEAVTLSKPINGFVQSFDRLLNAEMGKEVARDSDWNDLEKAARGGPDVDPTLMNDIKARTFTPRVQQFARAAASKMSIEYIARTGDTSNLKVDWTAPAMRQFTEELHNQFLMAKSLGPTFSQFASIRSTEDKMAFLNQRAAQAVYLGMVNTPTEDPTGGMPPSAGGPQQQGAPQGQPVQQQRLQHTLDAAGRIEQGRRAGEARKAGKPPAPIGFPDEDTLPRGNSNYRPGLK